MSMTVVDSMRTMSKIILVESIMTLPVVSLASSNCMSVPWFNYGILALNGTSMATTQTYELGIILLSLNVKCWCSVWW